MQTQPAYFLAKEKKLLTYFLISTLFLFFVFIPAINIFFYAGDSLRYTFGGFDKLCRKDDGFYFMLTLGRPLQAYLDCVNFKFAYNLTHMALLRVIAIGLMAYAVALFANWLAKLNFEFWTALVSSAILIMIPGLYGDTIFTSATSLPVSLIFVLLSYHFVQSAHANINKNKYYGLAGLFLTFSLLTYPAITFFYGTLMLSKALFSPLQNWQTTKKELVKETFLFGLICLLYFIWATWNMIYNPQAPIPAQYHIDHPNLNITEIFSRLFLIGNVFGNLWQILPESNFTQQGWAIIFIVSLGLIAGTIKAYRQNKLNQLLQPMLFTIFLLLLSASFTLIIPVREVAGSRLYFGSVTAGLVFFLWCLFVILNIAPRYAKQGFFVLTLSFLVYECYYANVITLRHALYYNRTMTALKDDVISHLAAGNKNGKVKRIHYVLKDPEYPYNLFFQTNGILVEQYGQNTYPIKWCSVPRGVELTEKQHEAEMLKCLDELRENEIGITYSFKNEYYKPTANMVLIEKKNIV